MKLELIRKYFPQGTNGALLIDGVKLCATIELPWRNNEPSISCIPEGDYRLIKRYSPHFKAHLQVWDVPGRDEILIHPANDAAVFRMYGLSVSPGFSAGLSVILMWINLLVNIIYSIALLCIPMKKFYIKPY